MTIQPPLEMYNGVISCSSCVTRPVLNLNLPRLSYIEIPSIQIPFEQIPSTQVLSVSNQMASETIHYSISGFQIVFFIVLLVLLILTVRK